MGARTKSQNKKSKMPSKLSKSSSVNKVSKGSSKKSSKKNIFKKNEIKNSKITKNKKDLISDKIQSPLSYTLPEPPKKRSLFNLFKKDSHIDDEVASVPDLNKNNFNPNKSFVMPFKDELDDLKERYDLEYENKKVSLDDDYRERNLLIEHKAKELEQKEKLLEDSKKDFLQSKKEVHKLREEVYDKLSLIDSEKEKLTKLNKTLEIRKNEFEKVIEKKGDLFEELNKKVNKLTIEKHNLDTSIIQKREELNSFTNEYEAKIKNLKELELLLSQKESEIVSQRNFLENIKSYLEDQENKIVKKIDLYESDKHFLEIKEDEIIKRIKELENSKKHFEIEKQYFKNTIDEALRSLNKKEESLNLLIQEKLSDLENKKKIFEGHMKEEKDQLKEKEKELSKLEESFVKREKKINDFNKMKIDIKEIEKDYKKLSTKYNQLVSKYLKGKEIAEKEEELKKIRDSLIDKEKLLFASEQKIKYRKKMVDELEYKTYNEIKSQQTGFPYIHNDLDFQKNIEEKPLNKEIDIFDLLNETKELIKYGHIDTAREKLKKLLKLYSELELNNDKKSSIYYDILEIENSIELANLN